MKFTLLLLAVLPVITQAALLSHDHRHLARRDHSSLVRRANSNRVNKRCPNRRNNANANGSPPPAPSPSSSAPPPPKPSNTNKPKPNDKSAGDVVSHIKGLLNVKSDCGDIGATKDITSTTGPNGSEGWLNCGLHDAGGWRPPSVKVDDLVTKNLGDVIQDPNGPFAACKEFEGLFEKYAQENGIPSILLASFALQESSCKPDTTGGAGEQGLMQITKDKCGDAPGGNCKDPDFNIKTGAKFFTDTLHANDDNVILTIGMYNGWSKGLTFGAATAAGNTKCCRCQNNLDYIHQFLNGWLQGFNVYGGTPRIGSYFNLDKCH